MEDFKKLMVNSISDNPMWIMLEDNFKKYYIENNTEIKIPKKIHQIWLGGEFPDKYKRIRDTWIEKNPDWEYKLWTDSDIVDFNMENIELFNRIDNLGAKSDILRYEILYRHGGLYIDTDFECIKSFNDLLYLDFFTGTGHINDPVLFNGLISCVPGHKILRRLIDDIKVVSTNDFNEIMKLTGPYYFSSVVLDHIKNNSDEKNVVFPTVFFYPFPGADRYSAREDNQKSRDYVNRFITDKSYCVHLWYTSWQN